MVLPYDIPQNDVHNKDPIGEFPKIRGPIWIPNNITLIIRTPTKRSTNIQKQP